MKARAILLLVVVTVLTLPTALSQRPPDRPPGIDPTHWVSINENLGVVLVSPQEADTKPPRIGSPQALLLAVPSNGYFMIRTGSQWRRLVVVEPLRGPGDAG